MHRPRTDWLPYGLMVPAVVFLLVFFAYPMVQALALSFRGTDGTWTLRYFQAMLADTYFKDA
ncbi:MAG: hypothetical protein QN178_04140, partial [Armatimonadota bacterium]|nr:hypothetical protein [Armatimonadota bacterium]